jgi:hypothetical protein
MGITVEKPGKLRREIYRLPKGEAIPLLHDSFLSEADVMLTNNLKN